MKHFMLKIYFTILLTPLLVSQVQADKAPIKFGKVTMEELEMKTYLPDTTASAVILCDYGQINDYGLHRTTRIKILNKKGLEWANIKIPYYYRNTIERLKGATYNLENGNIVKTDLKSDGKFLENTTKYSRTKKITMPNVKVGSVIEYSYSIGISRLTTWYFQYSIPVKWSEFRLKISRLVIANYVTKGYLPFATNKFHSTSNFQLAVSEAPAFKKEPYMTTSKNFLSSIEFEVSQKNWASNYTNTWKEINENLLEDESFGFQLKGGGFLKDIVAKINAEAKTDADKMNMAFDFVKKHMKWNDHKGRYVNTTLRIAFKEKQGNAADINLMLVLLLKKLGLNTDPVILSTRSNGVIFMTQAIISKFNYVVAKVKLDEKDYLLDATEPLCPCNILPFRCINGQGRVISEAGSTCINLKSPIPYKHFTSSKLTLNDDGELFGQITDSHQGYAALSTRKYFESKTIDEIKTSLEENNQGLSIKEFEIINQDDIEKTLQTKSEVEITDKVEDAGDLIYLNPMLYEQTLKNPFTLQERKYPVDYGHSYDEIYSLEISIPEGCSFESKPENMRMALPNKAGSYTYSIQIVNNKVKMMSRLRITKTMFVYDEYPYLKEFYKRIVAKQAEMIVIKRDS